MKNLIEALRRFKEVSAAQSDEDCRLDDLEVWEDASDELKFLVVDLKECLDLIDVDDSTDSDAARYRRRHLVRRLNNILDD